MERAFLVSWAGTVLQLSLRTSLGIISLPISRELNLNPVEIGLIASVFYLGYVNSSIPWGMLADSRDPIGIISLCSLALVPLMISGLILANYTQLVIILLLSGLISAGIFPSSMKVVYSTYQPRGLTSKVELLETSAPFTLIALSIASPIIIMDWRYFFGFLATSFLILYLFSGSKAEWVRKGRLRRPTGLFTDRKILLAIFLRMGELWATWGAVTWIFPLLVLYRGMRIETAEILLLLFSIGQLGSTLTISRTSVKREKNFIGLMLFGFLVSAISLALSPVYLMPLEVVALGFCSFAYRPPTDSMIMRIAGASKAGTSIAYANSVSQLGTMVAPSLS